MLLNMPLSRGPMLLNNSGRRGPYLLKTDMVRERIDRAVMLLAAPALWYAQWIQLYFERASLR